VRVALVGFGYWGPNLARNLRACPTTTLAVIADPSHERRAVADRLYPDVPTVADLASALLADVEAVVIATPASTHYPLAVVSLSEGKHVLVAKPLATNVEDAATLAKGAERAGLTLMVDHTFVYAPAVRKLRELVVAGNLGRLLYVDSARVNLGVFQRDIDVLWDLAAHDVSILGYLTDELPVEVAAVGIDPLAVGRATCAWLTCRYESGFVAHVAASWLSPVKVRRMTVAGEKRMVVYDDVEPVTKIRVYDAGADVDPVEAQVSYRTGDVWSPLVPVTEALAVEVEHFAAACAGTETDWPSGAPEALDVVRVLEAARRSLDERGAPVAV
jgi:predicted dehydrogenase